MILVTGATGNVGKALVDVLVGDGVDVIAVTRNPDTAKLPAAAQVVAGDPSKPATLSDALHDVEALFINPAATGDALPELLALAKERGVQRVVLLSGSAVEHGDPDDFLVQMFRRVESVVEASGLPHTFLRPGDFASNALGWAGQIGALGIVHGAYAESSSAPVHEHDIAAVAALALTDPSHTGKSYVLTGPTALTQRERVAIIGQALGRETHFQEIPVEAAHAAMVSHGFPPPVVDSMLKYQAAAVAEPAPTTSTVEELLGRPALTFAEWAVDNTAAFAPPPVSDEEAAFPGIFALDVTFNEGPKKGDVERHMLNFLPGGRLMLLVPPFPGAGRWSIEGDVLTFGFHEVVLTDGKPNVIVNIEAEASELSADRNTFSGHAVGNIYGGQADGTIALIAQQQVEQRAHRWGTADPVPLSADAAGAKS
ncbi:hypothetical protein DSM104299_04061 [Baekduia alba]|uniref:NAD(P)H-binding protein n=1 Tax=Baekduia alba TaxID=2997333 RepID=UPI002340AABC|nr:NAD(P)H-binding protein [Baekduia alba]WCB95318.1 hypothetical protein DSM104299_04061 [Baekduia alba]